MHMAMPNMSPLLHARGHFTFQIAQIWSVNREWFCVALRAVRRAGPRLPSGSMGFKTTKHGSRPCNQLFQPGGGVAMYTCCLFSTTPATFSVPIQHPPALLFQGVCLWRQSLALAAPAGPYGVSQSPARVHGTGRCCSGACNSATCRHLQQQMECRLHLQLVDWCLGRPETWRDRQLGLKPEAS